MKILFNAPQSAFLNPGGGEIQLQKTKKALEEKGHEVVFFDQFNPNLEDVDVVHNFSLDISTERFTAEVKSKDIPLAVSSIFWQRKPSESVYRSAKIFLANNIERLGIKLDYYPFSYKKRILDRADIVLPNGDAEGRQLSNKFNTQKKKIFSVPNGVDSRFQDGKAELFEEEYGVENFVLYVGGIGRRKNIHHLIRIAEENEIPLVVIGHTVSKDYEKRCRDLAGPNTVFTGRIDHDSEMLASAYKAADTFALPSFYETPGLVALEAGLADTKVIITTEGTAREYFVDEAWYVDPSSYEDIEKTLIEAYNTSYDTSILRERIKSNYTWDKVAERTLKAYNKIK